MKYSIEPLTREEVRRLIRHVGTRPNLYPITARNRALVTLLWRCGLRRAEAVDLMPADLDREKGTLRVRNGKGGKSRLLAIDDETGPVLDTWERHREKAGLNGHCPYFCTIKNGGGQPILTRKVWSFLRIAANKAGITKRVHPHGLRHTFAMELMEEGVPLNIISQAMGHSSSATTAIYLDHIAAPEVVNTLKARNWTND